MDPDERAIGNRDTVKIAIATVVSFVKEGVKRISGMQVNSKRLGQIELDTGPDKLLVIVQPAAAEPGKRAHLSELRHLLPRPQQHRISR